MRRTLHASLLAACLWASALALPVWAASPQPDADEITNEQMVSYYEQGQIGKTVWLVDSRPAPKFISGHIPGAVNLPLDTLAKDPSAAIAKLGVQPDARLVFYCAGRECTLSVDSAAILRKQGFRNVWVFRNGVPGWNQKAQPLLVEEAYLRKGNLILLDPQPGRPTLSLPGNTTVPLAVADIRSEAGQRLLGGLSRNAPIVVLSRGDMAQVNAALEELRDSDFRRPGYFALGAWSGGLAANVALPSSLQWAPVYAPGQVSPKAFNDAVASGKLILDVRPAADFTVGHFKGAVNLPIEDMERDYARVPRDVPVFVHCASGAKSTKAYDILSRKGYTNVAYLDAEISCKGETCTIKE